MRVSWLLLLLLLSARRASANYWFSADFGATPTEEPCSFAEVAILQLFESSSCTPNINSCVTGPATGRQIVCVTSPDDLPYPVVATYQYYSTGSCNETSGVVSTQQTGLCFPFATWSYRNSCNASHHVRDVWLSTTDCSGDADESHTTPVGVCETSSDGLASSIKHCYS